MRSHGGRCRAAAARATALVLLIWSPRVGAQGETRLTINVRRADFGIVEPRDGAVVVPARFQLVVGSPAAWELAVSSASAGGPPGRGTPPRLLYRTGASSFRDLVPTVPTAVASGPAATTTTIDLEIRPAIDWETSPGPFAATLHFYLNGVVATDSAEIRLEVPPRVEMLVSAEPFPSPPIDPLRPGRYAYLPRTVLVTSNLPWRLVVLVDGPPRKTDASSSPVSTRISLVGSQGRPVPLAADSREVVATGGPTGAGGRMVPIEFQVETTGTERAGSYRTRLRVVAEPDPSR